MWMIEVFFYFFIQVRTKDTVINFHRLPTSGASPTSQDITIVAASSLWQYLSFSCIYLSLQLLDDWFVLTIKQKSILCSCLWYPPPPIIVTAMAQFLLRTHNKNVIYSKWTHHWCLQT